MEFPMRYRTTNCTFVHKMQNHCYYSKIIGNYFGFCIWSEKKWTESHFKIYFIFIRGVQHQNGTEVYTNNVKGTKEIFQLFFPNRFYDDRMFVKKWWKKSREDERGFFIYVYTKGDLWMHVSFFDFFLLLLLILRLGFTYHYYLLQARCISVHLTKIDC